MVSLTRKNTSPTHFFPKLPSGARINGKKSFSLGHEKEKEKKKGKKINKSAKRVKKKLSRTVQTDKAMDS